MKENGSAIPYSPLLPHLIGPRLCLGDWRGQGGWGCPETRRREGLAGTRA